MGQWESRRLPDFLSGILLGSEIASALLGSPLKSVRLLGDEPLCQRYAAAFAQFGIACDTVSEEATTHGQWLIARAAGLCA
jgi:2-dehydro-3-deoxygalactonokinase